MIGTTGILPGTIMYVYLGTLVKGVAELGTDNMPATREAVIIDWAIKIMILVTVVAISLYIAKIARKALKESVPETEEASTALTDFFDIAGPNSIWVFMAAHVVAYAVGIPGTLLVVVGGAVFGLLWGTLWSVIGATLGALAAFLLARYLLHDWFKKRFYHKPVFKKINVAL